ncbi:MAG: oligosaccharide flippase family protein [Bacteroidota bacterium]
MNVIAQISKKALEYINKGQKRSVKAKKNILASFLIKGGSILIGFVLVRLYVEYLGVEKYGMWDVIASILTWFTFFDVGLDKGLRNRFAQALAKGQKEVARSYVSTTYAILAVISVLVLILFFLIQPFLNWATIFNVAPETAIEMSSVMLAVFSFFSMNFVLKIITTIYKADQRPAFSDLISLVNNILILLITLLLINFTQPSLLYLGATLAGVPVLVLAVLSVISFRGEYKEYSPSLKYVKKEYFGDLASLGYQFFIIQIISIIIFSTDKMIITQLFGPEEVPSYSVAHKYFGMVTKIFTIIIVPFWSAYTEAYNKNDFDWIRRTNQKLRGIWKLLVVLSIILLSISPFVYQFWVPQIQVPFLLSLCMFFYVNILAWGRIFVIFINGVGKVRLQMLTSIIGAVINIPLSIFFARNLDLGSAGVIMASIICLLYGPLLAPVQYKKIISKTAKGIWNK